jgi:Fe-S-cluster containining protein
MPRSAKSAPIVIDPKLSQVVYRCHPHGCPPDRTCCVGLAVEVSRREMRVIDSLMDVLAMLLPELRVGTGFANVFDIDAGEVQIEPRDEDGTCPFLHRTGSHALCAIHSVALQTGRDVTAVKPRACRHWPLVLESRGGVVRITVHPDAQAIGCVAPREELPGQPTLCEAFAAEIDELQRLAT